MITIHTGNYDGRPIYLDIPEDEWNQLSAEGFTPSEIELFYKITDWQQDC